MDFEDILTPTKDDPIQSIRKKNYVVVALDRSGSMTIIKSEAIDFFNSQIEEARNNSAMDNHICLVTFGDDVRLDKWDVPADEVSFLDGKTYQPDGFTPLYDAIGKGITELLKQPDINEPHVSVLFIVITDGHNNSSKEYDSKSVASLIKEMTATDRWTFAYLGSVDLSEAEQAGFDTGNMMMYAASPEGMTMNKNITLCSTRGYYDSRLAGATNVKNFFAGNSGSAGKEDN